MENQEQITKNKIMKPQSQFNFEIELHHISSAIENLRYALMYCSFNSKNTKYYIDRLNEEIKEYYDKYLKNN